MPVTFLEVDMNPLTGEDMDHRLAEALPKQPKEYWTAAFRFHYDIPVYRLQKILEDAGYKVYTRKSAYEVRPK